MRNEFPSGRVSKPGNNRRVVVIEPNNQQHTRRRQHTPRRQHTRRRQPIPHARHIRRLQRTIHFGPVMRLMYAVDVANLILGGIRSDLELTILLEGLVYDLSMYAGVHFLLVCFPGTAEILHSMNLPLVMFTIYTVERKFEADDHLCVELALEHSCPIITNDKYTWYTGPQEITTILHDTHY